MSDRIHQLIDTVREKSILLKDQVASERSENQRLKQEIDELKQSIASRDEKISGLEVKVVELNDHIETVKKENITVESASKGMSNEQIDELVKEIEYCITQLKK